MDTSLSIDSNPKIKFVYRDRPFYDIYDWALDFRFHDASCLRMLELDHDSYLTSVMTRWNWRNASGLPTLSGRRAQNVGGSWQVNHSYPYSQSRINNLFDMAQLLWSQKDISKIVVYYGWIYIYARDLEILPELEKLAEPGQVNIKQAVISRPHGSIARCDPVYTSRTFFRGKKISADQKNTLKNWLIGQSDLRLGPACTAWLSRPHDLRTHDHHWFEHNDSGIKIMLEMILPGIIGRSRPIIAINKI